MKGINYDDLRIYDGRKIQENLSWKPRTGEGTKKKEGKNQSHFRVATH